MQDNISEYICRFQSGNRDAGKLLLERLDPMLKYAAYSLGYEDAYSDLVVELLSEAKRIKLERLKATNDAILITYFHQIVKHKVIRLRKKKMEYSNEVFLSSINEVANKEYEIKQSREDSYDGLILCDLKKVLSDEEYKIIYAYFFEDKSIAQISKQLGVSRQAINKRKLSALKKLKRAIAINYKT